MSLTNCYYCNNQVEICDINTSDISCYTNCNKCNSYVEFENNIMVYSNFDVIFKGKKYYIDFNGPLNITNITGDQEDIILFKMNGHVLTPQNIIAKLQMILVYK